MMSRNTGAAFVRAHPLHLRHYNDTGSMKRMCWGQGGIADPKTPRFALATCWVSLTGLEQRLYFHLVPPY